MKRFAAIIMAVVTAVLLLLVLRIQWAFNYNGAEDTVVAALPGA